MRVFIAGAGTMGAGIAQVFAQSGHCVSLYDIEQSYVDKGISGLVKSLAKLVEKGKIEAAVRDATLSSINGVTDIEAAADCDMAVEAIIEDAAVKKELLRKLDAICGPHVILASNTSSISITELAAATNRPDKVAGMHFFNPAPVMKLVEVIRGSKTSDDTFAKLFALAAALGKEPVEVSEAPGFVVNRILIPMINEAVMLLEQHVASAADIDKAMCLGAGHPMGPLALSDLIGNDVVLNIMDTLYKETGDPKYRASVLLRKTVRAGRLGRKSGAGFHEYGK